MLEISIEKVKKNTYTDWLKNMAIFCEIIIANTDYGKRFLVKWQKYLVFLKRRFSFGGL